MRETFSERREIAIRALQREGLQICGPAEFGGTNLWIGGPKGLDSIAFATALREDGVLIEPRGAVFLQRAPDGSPVFPDRILLNLKPLH